MSRRLWLIDSEKLMAEARERTRLEDFGDTAIRERLDILANSVEHEASLHSLGRFLARMHLRDLLETRLRLVDCWKKSRHVDAEEIRRPVFITGMPRSGSTFLHELLVEDEESRAPLVWEVMFPPMANGTKKTNDDRGVKKAAACLWWFRRIAPRADSVHPMRATTPQECVAIHSYALLSQEFLTTFRVPSYESFLDRADLRPAYAWQKRFLQHLQAQRPGKRWVLKAPDHVFSLEGLFATFPDAVVIQTHRNPIDVLKSVTQLADVLRQTFAHPEEKHKIGEREARLLREGMERVVRFRDAHPELANRFLDVNYHQIVTDPMGTVRRCYQHLDLPLTANTEARVEALAASRSRYPKQRHDSALADFGIDVSTEVRRCETYCARFGLNPMGGHGG